MMLSENIKSRRSIRKFIEGAEVTDEQIKTLLEAAMLAPSACNMRPWEFVVVTNREKLNQIAGIHPHAKMLRTASLAIIVCALPIVKKGISEGFFPQDCAAASQNILLQAADLGLGSCWCGVYPRDDRIYEIRDILELPENVMPFNIIAVGTPDEKPSARGFYESEKVRFIR